MSYLNEDDIERLAENKCCGACKHWHRWDLQREIEYWNSNLNYKIAHDESSLHFGDCDKFKDVITFEDESYVDEYRCFKRKKVRNK